MIDEETRKLLIRAFAAATELVMERETRQILAADIATAIGPEFVAQHEKLQSQNDEKIARIAHAAWLKGCEYTEQQLTRQWSKMTDEDRDDWISVGHAVRDFVLASLVPVELGTTEPHSNTRWRDAAKAMIASLRYDDGVMARWVVDPTKNEAMRVLMQMIEEGQ